MSDELWNNHSGIELRVLAASYLILYLLYNIDTARVFFCGFPLPSTSQIILSGTLSDTLNMSYIQ